jgi:hypothetical protein
MPKYNVNIEGKTYEWDRDTITVAEIRDLAGFAPGQEVIEVDLKDQSERVLAANETVELKPGKGFGKKVSFKRGLTERRTAELELIREEYPGVEEVDGLWARIPDYPIPADWEAQSPTELAFQFPAELPAQEPYGFWLRPALVLPGGGTPSNSSAPVETPLGADWQQFSWAFDGWAPGPEPRAGSNMLDFVRSFARRLREIN